MTETWLEAFDENKISAAVMLDLSAAFDVVDTQILLDKLRLYGFEDNSVDWLQSYLTSRRQQVYVDGALSEPLEVNIGVPQGSILGPLLYTIFTNELPEVVHKHDPQDQQGTTKLFNNYTATLWDTPLIVGLSCRSSFAFSSECPAAFAPPRMVDVYPRAGRGGEDRHIRGLLLGLSWRLSQGAGATL